MKKQINPTIKAHLIRSAFYLLLLVAVCAIPFALAQSRSRGTSKQSLAKPNAPANMYNPQVANRADGAVSDQPLPNISGTGPSQRSHDVKCCRLPELPIFIPINPRMPAPTEYRPLRPDKQSCTGTPGGVTSQDFETVNDPFDTFTADDFVVPAGQTWNITEVDVAGEYSLGGGPAASFHVLSFTTDSATLPGTVARLQPAWRTHIYGGVECAHHS